MKKSKIKTKPKIWSTAIADKLFSKFIRDRDKKCLFCRNGATQNSHFWGRGKSSTRYDPLNCDGICGSCHFRHEGNKQGLYRTIKIKQLGEEGYAKLEEKAYSLVPRKIAIIQCMEYLNLVAPSILAKRGMEKTLT